MDEPKARIIRLASSAINRLPKQTPSPKSALYPANRGSQTIAQKAAISELADQSAHAASLRLMVEGA
jgi:hypothetical protein